MRSVSVVHVDLFMAKKIAVVIQDDPRKTHRPVEALRIALGLAAGSHETTVVLLGPAFRLLSDDTDEVVDLDILEKYLPSIQQLEIPFLLPITADRSLIRSEFSIQYSDDAGIRSFLRSVDRTLVF